MSPKAQRLPDVQASPPAAADTLAAGRFPHSCCTVAVELEQARQQEL
jgi:hypothetical protein